MTDIYNRSILQPGDLRDAMPAQTRTTAMITSVGGQQPDLEADIDAVSNEFGVGKLTGSDVEKRAVDFGSAVHAELAHGEQIVAARRQRKVDCLRRADALQ